MLNKTNVSGEIVLMEKFYNVNKVPYAKIYLKLTGLNELRTARAYLKPKLAKARLILSAQHEDNTTMSQETPNFDYTPISSLSSSSSWSDNLLYKVRTVFFRHGALSTHRELVRSILERAWSSRLDRRQYDSQNGLRVEVAVIDADHYLTNRAEHTVGFRYTVAVNGQEPEFLGIPEPTYSELARETNASTFALFHNRQAFIEFCPCSAYKSQRIYIK